MTAPCFRQKSLPRKRCRKAPLTSFVADVAEYQRQSPTCRVSPAALLLAAPLATAAAGLAGCGFGPMAGGGFAPPSREGRTLGRPDYRLVYGAWPGEQHPVPAFNYEAVDPAFFARRSPTSDRRPPAPSSSIRVRITSISSRATAARPAMGSASGGRASPGPAAPRSRCGAPGRIGCRRARWWRAIRRSAPSSS